MTSWGNNWRGHSSGENLNVGLSCVGFVARREYARLQKGKRALRVKQNRILETCTLEICVLENGSCRARRAAEEVSCPRARRGGGEEAFELLNPRATRSSRAERLVMQGFSCLSLQKPPITARRICYNITNSSLVYTLNKILHIFNEGFLCFQQAACHSNPMLIFVTKITSGISVLLITW